MTNHALALTAASALALGATSAACASPAGSTAAGMPTLTLATSASGTSYSAAKLKAPAGKPFLLVFENPTGKQHNVSLEQGELEYGATLTIRKGSTATVFTLSKGVYHFYSSVGNDENLGMSGTLNVG